MEVNFQSAMDEENTFEIGSNFKQVVEQQSSDPYCQLRTLTSESSSNYIRNTWWIESDSLALLCNRFQCCFFSKTASNLLHKGFALFWSQTM